MRAKPLNTLIFLLIIPIYLAASQNFCLSQAFELFNHPELKWQTIKTEHFYIHYYPEVELTAREAARVADEIYDQVCSFYDYRLKKRVHVVIRDTEDIGNGKAVYYQNWITIWATNLHSEWRGRHEWIKNVLGHEFAHIVSLKVASKFGDMVPAIFFGGLIDDARFDFFKDSRADIGIGFFLPGLIAPEWFVEGVAQFDDTLLGYETWDTHRDMLLRMAALDGTLLNLDEMGTFTGKDALQSEMVYNQGFSFISFLAGKFGLDTNKRLAHSQGKALRLSFRSNLKNELEMDIKDLYAEWVEEIEEKYRIQVKEVSKNRKTGEEFDPFSGDGEQKRDPEEIDQNREKGLINFYVRSSPDGKWMAFISGRRSDFLKKHLYVKEIQSSKNEKPHLIGKISSTYSWSPDSKKIVYSRRKLHNLSGHLYNELFIYDIEEDESEQIVSFLRATDPAWSPCGRWIAYIENRDGQKNLMMIRPDGSGKKAITEFKDFTQVHEPAWSPDGELISVTIFRDGRQDIWLIRPDGSGLEPLTADAFDDRNPSWMKDSRRILFSSDRTGIFNIYSVNIDTKDIVQLTNVLGGAFWPSTSLDGNGIVYSNYTSYGYRLYEIPFSETLNFTPLKKSTNKIGSSPHEIPAIAGVEAISRGSPCEIRRSRCEAISQGKVKEIGDSHPGLSLKPKKYGFPIRPPILVPAALYEGRQIKVGAELSVSDYLDKHELFGEILAGSKRDQDYKISYINRQSTPSIFLHLLRYIRNRGGHVGEGEKFHIARTYDFIIAGALRQITPDLGARMSFGYRNLNKKLGAGRMWGEGLGNSLDLIRNYSCGVGLRYMRIASAAYTDVNPRGGRELFFSYSFTRSILSTYLKEDPIHVDEPGQDYRFHRIFIDYNEYIALPWPGGFPHTLIFNLLLGYTDRNVHYYDELFAGGRLDFRAVGNFSDNLTFLGYDDFSIHGEAMAITGLTYRFPIIKGIRKRIGPIFLDSLYGSIFSDFGNAYRVKGRYKIDFDANEDGDYDLKDVLTNAGVELRLKSDIFYGTPWGSYIRLAHGFRDPDKAPLRAYIGIGTNF